MTKKLPIFMFLSIFILLSIVYAAPTIQLISPANNIATNSTSLSFSCNQSTATNEGSVNISMYDNFGGSWASRFMNTSPTNFTAINNWSVNMVAITDGAYVWNCQVCNLTGNICYFATANYSITIDDTVCDSTSLTPTTVGRGSTLTLTTDDANCRSCRYGFQDLAFASLPNVFTSNGTSQTASTTTMPGSQPTFYVRCQDQNDNTQSSSSSYAITEALDDEDDVIIISTPKKTSTDSSSSTITSEPVNIGGLSGMPLVIAIIGVVSVVGVLFMYFSKK